MGKQPMSLEAVRTFLQATASGIELIETDDSSATVEPAAKVLGVEPAQIAKTICLRVGDKTLLIVRGARSFRWRVDLQSQAMEPHLAAVLIFPEPAVQTALFWRSLFRCRSSQREVPQLAPGDDLRHPNFSRLSRGPDDQGLPCGPGCDHRYGKACRR